MEEAVQARDEAAQNNQDQVREADNLLLGDGIQRMARIQDRDVAGRSRSSADRCHCDRIHQSQKLHVNEAQIPQMGQVAMQCNAMK